MPKKTFEISRETGNSFLVQVKDNQPQLLKDCKDTERFNTIVEKHDFEIEKARGRIETRKVCVHKTTNWVNDSHWKALLATVIVMERTRRIYNTKTKIWNDSYEKSYYVCDNENYSAEQFGSAIRKHWAIENNNHYVKDVAFKEDASKIKKCPAKYATMRSIALNVLRFNGVKNICNEIYRNSINFKKLKIYGNIFD